MRRSVAALLVVATVAAVAACQQGQAGASGAAPAGSPAPTPAPTPATNPVPTAPPPPPVPDVPGRTAYARDVARICRVEELAPTDPDVSPTLATAQYLAANIESDDGRKLAIKVNQTPLGERAALLDAAAAEVGLTTGCPTARRWEQAASSP